MPKRKIIQRAIRRSDPSFDPFCEDLLEISTTPKGRRRKRLEKRKLTASEFREVIETNKIKRRMQDNTQLSNDSENNNSKEE